MDCVYQFELTVPDAVVDVNRHINNVAYVQWMQEAAIRHSDASGCTRMTRAAGAMWVARTHRIEDPAPGLLGTSWPSELGSPTSGESAPCAATNSPASPTK